MQAMRDPIQRYFRIGTLQWMSFPDRDVVETVRAIARDAFFDAVEVCHIPDAAKRREVRHIIEQAHMTVSYAAQPMLLATGLNPNALEEAERLEAEAALLDALREAQELGAEGFSFMAGHWRQDSREQAFAQLVKTTRTLCDAARHMGMLVELEPFDFDMDKAVLIGSAPLAARLAEEVRRTHGNFGILADLSHIPTTYETIWSVVRTLRPYITHFHIGNAVVQFGCEGYGDQHPRFGYPNSAHDTPELQEFFRVLRAEGFLNHDMFCTMSIEVKPRAGEDAELVLTGAKRVINRAWAMLED